MVRVGLVLGAGGVTGEAFHRGVLTALLDTAGWDAREAEIVVGTSAGALVGSSLRVPAAADRRAAPSAAQPEPVPRAIGGFGVLTAAARRPWRMRTGVLATALVPAGRQSTDMIADGVSRRFRGSWPERPLWTVAVRRRDGARVVFGRTGAPPADVGQAVAASCAVPGYFAPVVIDGVDYIDGGVHSPTNADLLVGEELDLVVVSSPMSTPALTARPRVDLAPRLMWHRYAVAEARRVRRSGIPVLLVEPDTATAAVLGLNTFDGRRLDVVEDRAAAAARAVLRRASNAAKLALLSPHLDEPRG